MKLFGSAQEAIDSMAHINLDNYFDNGANPDEPATTPWSKSALFKVSEDPASWMAKVPFIVTEKMKFGSLVDDYLFWPSQFKAKYEETSACPWNKNPGKAEAMKIRSRNKTPVKPKDMDRVRAIEEGFKSRVKSNHSQKMLDGEYQYLTKGAVEINYTLDGLPKTVFLPIKGLLDSALFTGGKEQDDVELFDMKITSAKDIADVWSIYTGLGYHWQEVIYSELMTKAGYNVKDFHFVFSQSEPPHQIWIVKSDENLRAVAKTGISRAFMHVLAIIEGWTPEDFTPAVLTFGKQNPWERFMELPEELLKRIKIQDVEFHA